DAVMVWVPERRFVRVMLAPVPREPSRLDVQVMPALRSPSSASEAVPAKVIASPGLETEPVAGAMMRMGGATWTGTRVLAVRGRLVWSATVAVMVWVPARSEGVIDRPWPRLPSRLDDQVMAVPRSPSSASVAVAEKVLATPKLSVEPDAGASMRMV